MQESLFCCSFQLVGLISEPREVQLKIARILFKLYCLITQI